MRRRPPRLRGSELLVKELRVDREHAALVLLLEFHDAVDREEDAVIDSALHPHYAWAGREVTIEVHGVRSTDLSFVNAADEPRKK